MKKDFLQRLLGILLAGTLAVSLTACAGGNEDLVSKEGQESGKAEQESGGEKTKLVFQEQGRRTIRKMLFNR